MKLTKTQLMSVSLAGLLLSANTLKAGLNHSQPRADSHAPISIMGDHTHKKSEWMLSYRYMYMDMDGMRQGNNRINSASVFGQGYTVTPEWMTMEMHMLGAMYAPNEQLTLMLMTHFTTLEMRHRIFPGAPMMLTNVVGGDRFTTRSSGLGDTKLGALYTLYETDKQKLLSGLSLSLPTGSITERDRTPRPAMPPTFNSEQLPASMQLGSGTYDLIPSLTYVRKHELITLGLQSTATIRLESENDQGYRKGHRFEANAWISYLIDTALSLNTGLRYHNEGQLKGVQQGIGQTGPNGRSVTTAFNENYGGERIDLSFGANYIFERGVAQGHRLAFEVQLPIWQKLNGIQLETDSIITVGWQKAF
jgi:hypothetical protein